MHRQDSREAGSSVSTCVRTLVAAAITIVAASLCAAGPATAKSHHGKGYGSCTEKRAIPPAGSPLAGVCDYLGTREGVVQVALFDKTTGRTFSVENGHDTQYTASIVKVDILAKWLNHFEHNDVNIPGGIDYSIRYLMTRMIQNSDNAAATALFYFGGGCDAITHFNRLIPLHDTKVGCESPNYYGWGNTETTARDQVRLMKVFAYGKPHHVLGHDARAFGSQLMQGVEPDQRFGITCGPWGTVCDPPNYANPVHGTTVALKNGWKTLPTCTQPIPQCPWQVNSTGWVEGQGRQYVLTVLTTKDPVGSGDTYGFNYGIDTIQGVSKLVWQNLGS
jgi:Beta-lactamase enzyme family